MKINVNNPSFLSFLDEVSNTIIKNVPIKEYFSMSNEGKLGIQLLSFKFVVNATDIRVQLTEIELKNFITVLLKKNEEIENYEFASVLKDIIFNFTSIYEVNKPQLIKKPVRKIRTDKTNE